MPKIHHRLVKHYHHHKHFLPHYFAVAFYTFFALGIIYHLLPARVFAAPTQEIGLDAKTEVVLWGPVNIDNLEVKSNYDTPLTAKLINGDWPLQKKLIIVPEDLLYPNTEYSFEILTKNWLGFSNKKIINVTTNEFPRVALANEFTDKSQISASTKFEFEISKGLDAKYFEFKADPPFEFNQKTEGQKLVISPLNKLKQGQDYAVSFSLLSQTLGNSLLYADKFSVIDPLEIVASNPSNGAENVLKQTTIDLTFNKIVDQVGISEKIKIEPYFEYEIIWKDGQNMVLKPRKDLQTATKYTLALADTISSPDGSQLTENKIISFSVAGKVAVVAFSPTGNSVNHASSISVTFNQPVDQASAQASFSLSPETSGNFSWSGNQLNYKPNSLALLTTYTINIKPGVESIGGEDSTQNFSSTFTTTSERSRTIGYSVRGRPITATYFGVGPKKILLIASMHGNETNTGAMLTSFISYLRSNQSQIGSDRTIILVPYVSPDGRVTGNRFNANNVDLNRNFDLPDWQSTSYWQNRTYPNGGGSSPFSEPESRALRDLVLSENPVLSITYHSNANLVIGDGIAQGFGDWYANLTGYKRSQSHGEESDVSALGYVITGTYEEWATKRGIPTLVIEFISQTANEYNRNFPALKGLLTYSI